MLSQLEQQTSPVKVAIVAGAYVGALLIALGLVFVYEGLTSGPDRDTYGGMYAFGDLLLFLVTFSFFSLIPTALAILLFRRSMIFWGVIAFFAYACASISAVAAATFALTSGAMPSGVLGLWMLLAVPAIFVSPFLMLGFAVCVVVAPQHWSRWLLVVAAGMEAVIALYGLVRLFLPMLLQ